MGSGYNALHASLLEIPSYLNRPNKGKVALEDPNKRCKILVTARVGCNNWQLSVNTKAAGKYFRVNIYCKYKHTINTRPIFSL